MKSILFRVFSFMILASLFVGCSWEELPSYEEADISGVQFYYRWPSDSKDPITNEPVVKEQRLDVSSTINQGSGVIEARITVPNAVGAFTAGVRSEVSANKLWGQVSVSKAARITPIEGSSALGTPDDWSKERKFKVVSASGKSKVWTIKVVEFKK